MQNVGFRAPRQCPVLTGSPSPRARTVNAKCWVQSAQAVSRFDGEARSPRTDGQCKAMGSERPGSVPFRRGVQVPVRGRSMQSDGDQRILNGQTDVVSPRLVVLHPLIRFPIR